jgi:hypothetical protein
MGSVKVKNNLHAAKLSVADVKERGRQNARLKVAQELLQPQGNGFSADPYGVFSLYTLPL